MSCPAPASDGSLDSALLVLEREFLHGRFRWRGLSGAVLAHAMLIGAVLLPALNYDRADRPSPSKTTTTVFAPPPESETPAPEPAPEPEVAPAAQRLEQPRIQLPETPVTPAPVNLSSIRLSFADDVREQLPEVVQAQGGMLALLDRDDLTIASYLFQAPAWEPQETIRDVSRMLRIAMSPPQKWAVFRDAAQHGIALDRYQACALFDIGYRSCLQNAIRRRAKGAPVSAVVLAVAPDSPCGIDVQEVTFAASPAVHP